MFTEWKLGLLWKESAHGSAVQPIPMFDLVKVFLATRPEHRYARQRLYALYAPRKPEFSLNAEKWAREVAAEEA